MATPDVPPPPTEPAWRPPADRQGAGLPGWLLPLALVVALVAAAVTGTLAFTQHQRAERLRAELVEAEARIAELEAERGANGGGLGELFGDLFGGENGVDGLLEGGLDALLDELFGGGGGPGGLGDGAALSRCLAGGGRGGGDPPVADTLGEQIGAVVERVEAMRGLSFSEPVEPQLLPTGEFIALITELAGEDYTAAEADRDRRVLTALGAVDPDVDLRTLTLDLVSEQAAGFYNDETGQLVLRADDDSAPLDPAGRVFLAHELQHAAADQNFGLPGDRDDQPGPHGPARAGLALVEGDATLFMQHFALEALDLKDQLALATDPSVTRSRDQLTGYPDYLQRELLFPYTEGLAFVCDLYADGGWPAVDAAYEALPTTTAQILWPERYAAGEGAVATADLGAPGGSWAQAGSDTLGAAELLWLFSAPGDDADAALSDPRERAAAWAGGSWELWTDGDDSAVGLTLRQRESERGLCESVADWYAAAFPDARPAPTTGDEEVAVTGPVQAAVVVCGRSSVRLGIASELATARKVVG